MCPRRVQPGRRFVQHQDFRAPDKRPRQRRPLLHPAAHLRGYLRSIPCRPTALRVSSTRSAISSRPSAAFRPAGTQRYQIPSSNRTARPPGRASRTFLASVHAPREPQSASLRRPSITISPESGRSSRLRCFSSTVLPHPLRPDDRRDLPARAVQVDAIQYLLTAKAAAQVRPQR